MIISRRKKLELYPATRIPVRAADLYEKDGKFTAFIKPNYPNSIGIPVFLAMIEYRASWGGHTRGAFRIVIQHPTKEDLELTATDLSQLNLTWRHIRRPSPGLHPWVMISWELTVPWVAATDRYYQNEGRFQDDLALWTRRNQYRS